MSDESNVIYCRLWKPRNENIKIICNSNKFDLNVSTFMLEEVSFNFNEYLIKISLDDSLYFEKKNYELTFLYSDRQFIDIKDDIELYNLNLK